MQAACLQSRLVLSLAHSAGACMSLHSLPAPSCWSLISAGFGHLACAAGGAQKDNGVLPLCPSALPSHTAVGGLQED